MIDRIRASLPSLAPAEQRVAQLVLAEPRLFANLPISELAARAQVSKPTVVRFCRSVGYDGLTDFKLKLGITSIAYSDGHMQVMSASLLGLGDCVLVSSNSGRTRDLIDAAGIARKNGATTIVITVSGSPLASAGTIHLAADHPEGYVRYSPIVSRLMHLMIIDIVATCVALRIGAKLQPLLKSMKDNLRSKRYA